MLIAGGAVAAVTACGSSSSNAGALDASDDPNPCCNANPDPCCQCSDAAPSADCVAEMQCQANGGAWEGGQCVMQSPNPCCNGNPDPCCPSEECGAAVSPLCTAETQCYENDGVWVYQTNECILPDAGSRDAAPGDAGTEAEAEAEAATGTEAGADTGAD